MPLPTFDLVVNHSIRSPNLVRQFNEDCACSVVFHQLPDLLNNRKELRGNIRIEIDLLNDYLINFVYLPILYTDDFQHQGPLMLIQQQ